MDYERAKSLFMLLKGLPLEQREARLLEECPDDSAMRAEVTELLKTDGETFLAAKTGYLPAALDAAATIAADEGYADQARADGPSIRGYKIEDELGRGGMGVVWRARHLATGRTVALKLVSGAHYASLGAIERFKQEVNLAAALEHENIARVYDGDFERGVAYYTMELVDGLPLDQYAAGKKLSRREIVELMRTLAGAVQFAHRKRVIHRDLKPSNVMVTKEGVPKLLDFGLAKISSTKDSAAGTSVGNASAARSLDGYAMGTPNYMPPEQARGRLKEIDTRADIFALGAVLFELLTRQLPRDLKSGSKEAVAQIANNAPIRRPRSIDRTIPLDLEAIILKALSSAPDDRYSTADDFADDLTRFLTDRPVKARRASALYVARKWAKRNWIAVAAAAALAAGVSAYIYQINSARAKIAASLLKEEKQRQIADFNAMRADEQRHTALATIKEIVFGAQRNLSQNLAQEPIRRRLMEIANEGLRRIALDAEDAGPEVDRTAAAVLAQVGEIFLQTGAAKDAQESFEKAIERLEAMGRKIPTHEAELKRKRDLVVARLRLARLHLGAGRAAEARQQVAPAAKLVDPTDVRIACGLKLLQGDLDMDQRSFDRAIAHYEAARSMIRSAGNWPEGEQERERDLSAALKRLATSLCGRALLGDLQGGLKLVGEAIKLDRGQANSPRAKLDLMSGLTLNAELFLKAGDTPSARKPIEEALTLAAGLASNTPDHLELQKNLALAAFMLGDLEQREGRQPEAMKAFDQCIGALAPLEKDGRLTGLQRPRELLESARKRRRELELKQ